MDGAIGYSEDTSLQKGPKYDPTDKKTASKK